MKLFNVLLLSFAFLPVSLIAAENSDRGATNFRNYNCTSCHGPKGQFPILSHYPKLSGQPKEYLVQQLKDFRAGTRAHGTSKIMTSIARSIPEAEFEDLAAYLAGLSTVAGDAAGSSSGVNPGATSAGAQAFVARNCHTCHGEAGRVPVAPNYPVLAGQNPKYLLTQMLAIKSGERANGMSMVMKAMIAEVPENDFKDIAEYLHSAKK